MEVVTVLSPRTQGLAKSVSWRPIWLNCMFLYDEMIPGPGVFIGHQLATRRAWFSLFGRLSANGGFDLPSTWTHSKMQESKQPNRCAGNAWQNCAKDLARCAIPTPCDTSPRTCSYWTVRNAWAWAEVLNTKRKIWKR